MKKIVIIITSIILLLIFAGMAYARGYVGLGIQQCPEAWYDNQMPPVDTSGNTQYLIVNGERRELSEFNTKWIQSHCEITGPSVVQ